MLTLLIMTQAGTDPDALLASCRAAAKAAWGDRWHVAGRLVSARDGAGPPFNYDCRFELWRDGRRRRADFRPTAKGSWPVYDRLARRVTGLGWGPSGDRFLMWQEPETAVELRAVDRDRPGELSFDPAMIGFGLDDFYGQARPDKLLDTGRRPLFVGPATVRELPGRPGVLRVAGVLERSPATTLTLDGEIDVDTARGPAVVRILRRAPAPEAGQTYDVEMTVSHRPDPATGRWHAAGYTLREACAGKGLFEETVTLEVTEPNRPPDPAAFTLAGLAIPVGEAVRDVPAKTFKYWDGGKVVDRSPFEAGFLAGRTAPTPTPVAADGSAGRWAWAAAAGVLLAAALAVWRYRR